MDYDEDPNDPGLVHGELTERLIGAAVRVHRNLGPGLLESAYEACLVHELTKAALPFARQLPIPVVYDGVQIDCGFKIDLLIDRKVLIELKAVEKLLPVHEAQLLTYLKLADIPVGLLINFNVPVLTKGILRRANTKASLRVLRELRGENGSP